MEGCGQVGVEWVIVKNVLNMNLSHIKSLFTKDNFE